MGQRRDDQRATAGRGRPDGNTPTTDGSGTPLSFDDCKSPPGDKLDPY
ncbi:hypothetical protein [Streptomyces sp. NPDC001135]